jgi:hypothetical protein
VLHRLIAGRKDRELRGCAQQQQQQEEVNKG